MAYPYFDRPGDLLEDGLDHCLTCGVDSPAGARFCRRCGRPMAGLVGGEASTSRRPEHKQVTVLFADVQGSMVLSERLDPEEWYGILVRFFVILAEGVQRVGGVVNRFTGDGIMALFGAPLAQEDHAQRACYAALRLRHALRAYAAELRATRGVDLGVRIGISSGDVVAATLGGEGPTNYTALGHTVHVAAAMERLAEPGHILVSERTASLVEGYFRLSDRGELHDRGRGRRVHAFELTEPGAFHTRFDRARWQGLLRFVGRAGEMRALERALDDARGGQATIVGVRGEIGIGKSRLCQEFVARCAAENLPVYEWRVLSHLSSTPFLNLITELRRLFTIRPEDSREVARRRIEERLHALGGSAGEVAPLVALLLGLSADGRAGADLGNPERLKLLIGGCAAALGGPAVLLIEDVHWIDSASARILDLALECIGGTRILVVLNFRPEYRAPRLASYREMTLAPLGPRATNELLRQLLGDDPALAEVAAQVRQRTRGNPFFMEELVAVLASTGVLIGCRGAHALGPNRDLGALPSSLQALLESRIDRLPASQKAVLQTAAVLGETFSVPLLQRVTGLSDAHVSAAIAGLEDADLVMPCGAGDETQRTFRHPLMQEQAYRMQVKEDLAARHAEVARACIAVYAERLDEHAALIADHLERAGSHVAAASWGARAAAWVAQRNLAEGLRRWRSVCEVLEHAPRSGEVAALAVQARTRMLELGGRLGMSAEESARIFAEARAAGAGAVGRKDLALLYRAYGQARGFVGAIGEALDLTRDAARLAEETGDERFVVRLRVALCYALLTAGRLTEASELCEYLIARIGAAPPPDHAHLLGYLHAFRAALRNGQGRPREARSDLARAADAAWRSGNAELLAQIYAFETNLTRVLGDPPGDCMVKAQRAVEIADYLGNPYGRVFAYWSLGNAHLLGGDARTAAKILHGVLLLARDHGVGLYGEAGILADLASATLARGDGAVALSIAEEAVQVGRRRGAPDYEALALLARASILLDTTGASGGDEIEACLDRVREIVAREGATAYLGLVHLHLGQLAELRGDAQGAAAALDVAQRHFAAMGARGWVEEVEQRRRREVAA